MSFSQMVKILKEENKGKILFVNAGAFYIAIEEDAVLLNSKLKLKCSCFQKNICKVGVPIQALDKYLEKIENLKYAYIVYNIDKEKKELKIIKKYEGKNKNKTEKKHINCLICKGIKAYPEDEYLEALNKYYEKKEEYNEI